MALLFRFLTPVRVPWRGAIVAGVVTALLLAVGTSLTGWYLRSFGGASVAGAFGAILATLTWIYFEAQILLGGVQLVKVLMISRDPALQLEWADAAPEGRALVDLTAIGQASTIQRRLGGQRPRGGSPSSSRR